MVTEHTQSLTHVPRVLRGERQESGFRETQILPDKSPAQKASSQQLHLESPGAGVGPKSGSTPLPPDPGPHHGEVDRRLLQQPHQPHLREVLPGTEALLVG